MRTRLGAFATLALVVALAGCGGITGTSSLGYAEAPASLEPNSPTLAAKDIAFTKAQLDVAADTPFILVFENRDGVSHNVSIYPDGAATTKLFDGVLFAGPATRWYPVPALAAGTYVFRCDLHPNMTGTLRAS
ncbi:MAG TPA: cupredoxin domain-containing protein [Candidatus Limnocylindrales bacterium]|nr:cupredoxin domain-containing protein [Candidatus Limnocylindrales bacterium]